MSIRVQLALLTAACGAFILFALHLCDAYLYPLLEAKGQSIGVTSFILSSLPFLSVQSFMLTVIIIVTSIFFLVVVEIRIARPIRSISRAVQSFTGEGGAIPVAPLPGAPWEIHELEQSLGTFSQQVSTAHEHDVEVSRVKSDFISTAAHQLRTPLTGIRWALEALEKEPLTDIQKQLVTDAVNKSHDLVAVVGTLLDISSIESGKYKYTFAIGDLSAVAREVATDFIPLAQQGGVSLSSDQLPQLPVVKMDRERLKWVLNNLIENAIRYTPSGGAVHVSGESVPGRVIIRVRDTGIGIQDKDRNNIFERFYRAGNAIAKENKGNGLGLYIARTIANDHGGELSFEANQEGPGTTFTLALPVAA